MTNPSSVKQLSSTKAFDTEVLRFQHTSKTLSDLPAIFSVILPPGESIPVLYWLSGLTCNDENFITKAGAAQYAKKYLVAIVCPDTSPRGAGAPGEDESWEFGTGAGFYVNATMPGYEAYQMADYVVAELPGVVKEALGDRVDTTKCSVFGHSMGGMGALSMALRNPEMYKSVSAFAPISNPVNCAWGKNCYEKYLGSDVGKWSEYDPTELMKKRGAPLYDSILVDQGTADEYLTELMPEEFVMVCEKVGQKVG